MGYTPSRGGEGTMRVFTDFHHAGLLNSLILLFEKRLGYELFRPIGTEWNKEGYWKIYDHPATVEQYLSVGGATPDGSEKLNEISHEDPPVYFCNDITSKRTNKAITYEGFMSMDFDIVIASIPQHIEPFKRLCNAHPSKPKLIYQIGNAWPVEANTASNVMASAIIPNVPSGINFISYHQEFDIKEIFYSAIDPNCPKKITSFVNCFSTDDMFRADWELFKKIEALMPGWDFKCHGGQGRDGPVNGECAVADTMRRSGFVWHTKKGGDGYGHIVHNTGAVARPMIVKKEYYREKMGEKLMIDGETCIVVDNLNPEQIVNKIKYYSETPRFGIMCNKVYANFKKVVNFDKEENDLRKFIKNLI